MSGLKSIKRDFSANTLTSSQSSEDGQSSRKPGVSGSKSSLSAQEKRLKLIQDALNGHPVPGERSSGTGGLSAIGHKRTSSALPDLDEPVQKRRQFPSNWNTASSQLSSQTSKGLSLTVSGFSSSGTAKKNASRAALSVTSSTSSSSKPAPVFLSQEQTHILKLVENGASIFYTGSAGKLILFLPLTGYPPVVTFIGAQTLVLQCRHRKVCSPPRSHQSPQEEIFESC